MLLEVLHGSPLHKQVGCFGQEDHDNLRRQLASPISGPNHLTNYPFDYSGPASNIALLHMALEGLSSTASSSSSTAGHHQPSFISSDSRSSLIQELLYHNLLTKPPSIISITPSFPHQVKQKGADNHTKPSSSSCSNYPLRKMDGEALVAQLMCGSCCSTEASSDFAKEESRRQLQSGPAAKKETLSASSGNTNNSMGWGTQHHENYNMFREHPDSGNNHGDGSNDAGTVKRVEPAVGGGHVNSRNSAEEGSTSCSHLNYTGYSCSVSSSAQQLLSAAEAPVPAAAAPPPPPKRKRKRARACKNQEEVESQRMTHIAVERNRRKQMNEHLNVLRSLMPPSYIQRGDQASIIGGAIEFVKELEQVLEALHVQKQRQLYEARLSNQQEASTFVDELLVGQHHLPSSSHPNIKFTCGSMYGSFEELVANSNSTAANVQVKMIGSTAMVKVLARRTPRQLLHTLSTIEGLHLKVMHLNITTIEDSVLYSFNLQVKEECQIHAASELADSIQHVFSIFNIGMPNIQKVENVCNITTL